MIRCLALLGIAAVAVAAVALASSQRQPTNDPQPQLNEPEALAFRPAVRDLVVARGFHARFSLN
jgi:hypothetical protein